jgi:hexosaminidase
MNIRIIILFSMVGISNLCFSQKKPSFDTKNLIISWELKEANYKGTSEMLSWLTFSNTGAMAIPPSGWTIYFNSSNPRTLNNDTTEFKIEQINGDFFILTPGSDFKGIPPQQAVNIPLVSRPLKNITDYAKGFYIVFDNEPSTGIPLVYENKTSINYHTQEKALAAKIYEQNKNIIDTDPDKLSPVFPTPLAYKGTAGFFTINDKTQIVSDASFTKEAGYLAEELQKVLGTRPAIGSGAKTNLIALRKGKFDSKEAYQLQISSNSITISAADEAGIFYGIQSLKNLFPSNSWAVKQSAIKLQGIEINDAPRFGHRAFMLDIARNFQPKAEILKLIDLLSLYKLNVLHMHFNDDEGWRIEIPGLPELTTVGSQRGHTITESDRLIPAYGSGPDVNNKSGSGYLSKADYVEILKYATARHIKVIPEFETPGHARAAIKSMDARYQSLMKAGKKAEAEQYLLRDINDQSVYQSVQGFTDNVINPALPSVYNFIEKITDETIAMYKEANAPLHTFHFGGDEVPAGVWEKSPVAIDLLKKDNAVTSIDELWHYYFTKVNHILKARNLYLSGWEEIGQRKALVNGEKKMVVDPRFANQNFHTDVWNNLHGNEDLAYQLANAGYKVVLTNVTNMYLDLAYNSSYHEPGQYWGGYVDADKPFSFIPFNYYKNQKVNERGEPLKTGNFTGKERLTEQGKANIVGLQAPLWSEIITSEERFEYLLLPKLLGLAERSWAPDPQWATEEDVSKSEELYQKAWNDFVNIVGKRELPRLDAYSGGFAYRIPTAGLITENGKVKANVQYPGLIIRYTTDGSEPDQNSLIYKGELPESGNLSFRVFNQSGRGGRTIKFIK